MSKSKASNRALVEAPKREEQAQWLAKLFADPSSIASQTAAAYSELLDEVMLDVSAIDGREGSTGRREAAGDC